MRRHMASPSRHRSQIDRSPQFRHLVEGLEPRRLLDGTGLDPFPGGDLVILPPGPPELHLVTPAGWSDATPISSQLGTHIDQDPLYIDTDLYIDVAVANTGQSDAGEFLVVILVDNHVEAQFTVPGLAAGATFIEDDLTLLDSSRNDHADSPGVTVYVDGFANSHSRIAEENEENNRHEDGFTVVEPPKPELHLVTPAGWSDATPITMATGTHADESPLYTRTSLYVDFAVANTGAGDAGEFDVVILVDNHLEALWTVPGLAAGATYVKDDLQLISPFHNDTPGSHSVTVYVDGFDSIHPQVAEDDEDNNRHFDSYQLEDRHPPHINSASTNAGVAGSVGENQAVSLAATFTDLDFADTHTATINWGDGATTPGSVTEAGGNGSVSGGHAYSAGSVYEITLTVTDNTGLSDSRKLLAYISGTGVQDGVLRIIGTPTWDTVSVDFKPLTNQVVVNASFLPKRRLYVPGSFHTVYIAGLGECDTLTVTGDVPADAIIDGGDGPDTIRSGRKSLLIGGGDADDIDASRYDDLIVAGSTHLDNELGALLAVLGGTRTLTAADVIVDSAADLLTGRRGADTFFGNFAGAGVLDCIVDRRPEDAVVEL